MKIKQENFTKIVAVVGLPPNRVCRGVFSPMTKTINSSIFRLVSVTHEQDSMPVKYNAFLINKQHPTNGVVLEIVDIKMKFSLSVPQTSIRRAAKRPWRNLKYV